MRRKTEESNTEKHSLPFTKGREKWGKEESPDRCYDVMQMHQKRTTTWRKAISSVKNQSRDKRYRTPKKKSMQERKGTEVPRKPKREG